MKQFNKNLISDIFGLNNLMFCSLFLTLYFTLFIFHCSFSQPTWVISGAPIGDTSIYIYFHKNDWAGIILSHNTNNDDSVRVSNVDTTGIYQSGADTVGIHVYRLHLACNISSVTNNSGRIQLNHPKPRDLFSKGDSLQLTGFTNYNGWDTVYSIVNDTAFVMDIAYTAGDAGTAVRQGVPTNITGITGLGGNDRYFGVFKTDTSISYDFTYYYAGNPYVDAGNESTLELFKRNDATAGSWTSVSGQTLSTTNDTIGATSQNTEFILGSSGAPLPIELLLFNARLEGERVKVYWTTATEINTDYYIAECSSNGIIFEYLDKISAAGNSNKTLHYYTYDNAPYPNITYYRLKQVDMDGSYTYSNIVALTIEGIALIRIYPVPAESEIIFLLTSHDNTEVEIKITDLLGRTIYNEKQRAKQGENNIYTIDTKAFSSGNYLLQISTANGLYRTQKQFVIKR